jgi:hypothetical protein
MIWHVLVADIKCEDMENENVFYGYTRRCKGVLLAKGRLSNFSSLSLVYYLVSALTLSRRMKKAGSHLFKAENNVKTMYYNKI